MYPVVVACYREFGKAEFIMTSIIGLNRTRSLHCGNFAFAASKRTAKT